ncbi:MAG: serine/threonine protein kinase [Archangiaceae bacterium]|nr:serine/threonine protein kinase [Archangiaceae bacterium]
MSLAKGESHLAVVGAPAAAPASLAVGQVLGSYRIEGVLGEGTMGRVYLGRHVTLDRPAALKVLHPQHTQDPSLIQRFFQEARLVNRIAHEHIVEVLDFAESKEPPAVYGVMELLTGQTLAASLAACAPSLEAIVAVGRQIATALQAAHAVGVVHRDLKPDNVFLVRRGGRDDYVKVLDFGVAKLAQGGPSVVATHSGALLGTPRYMAPEQAAGLEVDARTDVYALGVILYQMLAGRVPFEAANFGQLAADIITRPPPPLHERSAGGERIPDALRDLVRACLEKQPDARPPSMTSVESWLGRALSEEDTLPFGRALRARRPVVMAAAAALVLGLAGAVAVTRRTDPAPAPVVMAAAAAAVAPAVVAPAVPKVTLALTTVPAGARVLSAGTGELLGVSPWVATFPREAATLKLRIEAPGYEPVLREVGLGADASLELALKPLKVARPAAKKSTSIRNGVIDPF